MIQCISSTMPEPCNPCPLCSVAVCGQMREGLTCPGRKTGSFTGLSLVIFRGTNCLKDFPCRMPIGNLVGSFIAGSDKFTPGHPLISAHPKLYNSHCIVYTAQFTLYSAHCTIHTVQCTLHNSHCIVYTAQFTLKTVQYKLHTTHCKEQTGHWTKLGGQTKLPKSEYKISMAKN